MTMTERSTTWQEACRAELDYFDNSLALRGQRWTNLEYLGQLEGNIVEAVSHITNNLVADPAVLLNYVIGCGHHAAAELDNMGLWNKLDMLNLLVRKQRDYGHGNILSFGPVGIAVRICDKIARLKNLTSKNVDPSNESLVDTWQDIVGYAVIAAMWDADTFMSEVADA